MSTSSINGGFQGAGAVIHTLGPCLFPACRRPPWYLPCELLTAESKACISALLMLNWDRGVQRARHRWVKPRIQTILHC